MANEEIVSKPDHGDPIIEEQGSSLVASPRLQLFFDDITTKLNDFLLTTGAIKNLYSNSDVIGSGRIASITDTLAFTNGQTGFSSGAFGPTDGIVHIIDSPAGVIAAHPDGSELVLEHDTDGGMTFLNPDGACGNIYWGSPGDGNQAANFFFCHQPANSFFGFEILGQSHLSMFNGLGTFFNLAGLGTNSFQVNTSGSAPFLRIDATTDRMGLSQGASLAPTEGVLQIFDGGEAGVVTAPVNADAIVIESPGPTGITILSSDTGRSSIILGHPADNDDCEIRADWVNNWLNVSFDSTDICRMNSALFTWNPLQDDSMDFQVMSENSINCLRVSALSNRVSIADSGTQGNQGLVHMIVGGLSGADAPASGSTLILDANTMTGMTLLSPDTGFGSGIYFGNPASDPVLNSLRWAPTTEVLFFTVGGEDAIRFNGTTGTHVNAGQSAVMDFQVSGGSTAGFFYVDAGLEIVGISRTGLAPVHGALHIQQADAGAIAPSVNADLLVLEGTGEIGVTALVDNATGFFNFNFGDPSNGNAAGQIRYDASLASWFFSSTGTEMMRFNPTLGIVINETGATVHDLRVESAGSNHMFFVDSGNNRIGIADNGFAPSDGLVHLFKGGAAGVVAASTLADGIVMESNAATGFSILVPNDGTACNFFMGAPTSGNAGGKLIYVPSTGLMTLETSALPAIRMDTDQNILFGTVAAAVTSAAGALHIPNDTSPTVVLANGIVLGSKDSGAGGSLAVPELWVEEPPEVVGTFTPTMKMKVWVNGVEYFIQLDPV